MHLNLLRRILQVTCLTSMVASLSIFPASIRKPIPVTMKVQEYGYQQRHDPSTVTEEPANNDQPVAVYSPGRMYFPVLQQPVGNPAFVSSQPGRVTQFSMAADYGAIGLLAHNNLAGEAFFNLEKGQEIILYYPNGTNRHFRITEVYHFQALQPSSPYSDFIDLHTKSQVSSDQVFAQIYQQKDHLILQTCIAQNGLPNWGRLFVMAIPVRQLAGL